MLLAGGGALAGAAVAAVIGAMRIRLIAVLRRRSDDPDDHLVAHTVRRLSRRRTRFTSPACSRSVAAGLYAGWHDTKHLNVATRRHAWEVWHMLLYVFNSLAFLLLGLATPQRRQPISPSARGRARARTRSRSTRRSPCCASSGFIRRAYLPLLLFAAHPRARRLAQSASHFPRSVGRASADR